MLILCGIYGGKLKVVGNSGGIVVGSGEWITRWLWGLCDRRDDGGFFVGVWVKWLGAYSENRINTPFLIPPSGKIDLKNRWEKWSFLPKIGLKPGFSVVGLYPCRKANEQMVFLKGEK